MQDLSFCRNDQRGVVRQKVQREELDCIHNDLLQLFSAAGAPITHIYVCPHESGCECRKPEPGMLLRAAEEHSIDLHASWIVGDSATDIQAAGEQVAGRLFIHNTAVAPSIECPDLKAKDLPDAVKLILEMEGIHAGKKTTNRSQHTLIES